MLAKLTVKNQLTLPKVVTSQFSGAMYFDVQIKDGGIFLAPVTMQNNDAIRSKLDALGITEQDVQDAIKWARESK